MPNTGRTVAALATLAWVVTAVVATAPPAGADAVSYLVNVTVRPGYNFVGPDQAIAYGHGICGQVGAGSGYRDLVDRIKFDFATSDDYQGAYLINQAVNELCPAMIWQLRNSAATS